MDSRVSSAFITPVQASVRGRLNRRERCRVEGLEANGVIEGPVKSKEDLDNLANYKVPLASVSRCMVQ
jgi:hypothetical protein